MKFYTYILKSEKSGRYYVGHSGDLDARIIYHNSGRVRATRNKGPWVIVYSEVYDMKIEANKRELYIKSRKSRIFIESLIDNKRE